MEEEIINCERARIEELQKFSKWLKTTFHSGDFVKEEYRKWYNGYAENKYYELESEINYHCKLIKEMEVK